MCVTQRVKKSAVDAVVGLVGLAGTPKKSRTVIERHEDHHDAAQHVESTRRGGASTAWRRSAPGRRGGGGRRDAREVHRFRRCSRAL
jgi:hypothetical protein